MKAPLVIGWREWAELPAWGLLLRAKADTGAKSSAIDCAEITRLPDDRVRFTVRIDRRGRRLATIEAPIALTKRVRSSNGEAEERIFVRTPIRIAGRERSALVSLVCRKSMIHRMLLGRSTLGPDFLVHSSKIHLATPRRRSEAISSTTNHAAPPSD